MRLRDRLYDWLERQAGAARREIERPVVEQPVKPVATPAAPAAVFDEARASAAISGYTPEGLRELRAFMASEGIGDIEQGVAAFERANPAPDPVSQGGGRYSLYMHRDDMAAALEEMLADPFGEAGVDRAVAAALREVRGR